MRWFEDIADHLNLKAGLRKTLLSHSVRDSTEADPVLSPQAGGEPHSAKHGYVEDGMTHMAFQDHPWCREDDSQVHCMLEEASRGTIHTSSTKPFQKKKHGMDSLESIIVQCTGPEK